MGATAQLAAAAVCGTVRERGWGGFWVTVDSIGAVGCVDQSSLSSNRGTRGYPADRRPGLL